jgi:hypothetical protein
MLRLAFGLVCFAVGVWAKSCSLEEIFARRV